MRHDFETKKKLSYQKICHVLSWFNAVRHHHFLPNFLASPKPRKVARHIATLMNSESYIFLLCFSYFLIQFAWYFEKAEKIASMSEMLKKCRYNKHHKPFIYRQRLTVMIWNDQKCCWVNWNVPYSLYWSSFSAQWVTDLQCMCLYMFIFFWWGEKSLETFIFVRNVLAKSFFTSIAY